MNSDIKCNAVRLKPCTDEDIPAIADVARQSYKEHYLYLWTDRKYAAWYMDISFSPESLHQQMADPYAQFFLICFQNTNVGFIKLNFDKALPGNVPHKSIELERIYLLKEAAGKGIGTNVIKQVIQSAREKEKEWIWLKSMDSSPSVKFYQKMGFKIVGMERLPFEGFKDEYRHMVIMLLDMREA